jgi:membrane protease YdiL (CAAX protease family)
MIAGLLYGGAMLGHLVLTPHHTPREGWIMRVYLQLGDPRGEGRELVGLAVFAVAALEEIAWRGLVQRTLEEALGPLRPVAIASVLFALAHLPTVWSLGDPIAGPNPLVVLAGLGCSAVWGLLVVRTKRLLPAVLAHALFSWAIVEFPVWRP